VNRRKLIVEKVIDREITDVFGKYFSDGLLADKVALSAERFVVNSSDVAEMASRPDIVKSLAAHLPYSNMWFEVTTEHDSILKRLALKTPEDIAKFNKDYGVDVTKPVDTQECVHVTPSAITVYRLISNDSGVVRVGCVKDNVPVPDPKYIQLLNVGAKGEKFNAEDSARLTITEACRVVFCAIAMLNLQGDVCREKVHCEPKLNRVREKRGKPALRNYTYVNLVRSVKDGSATTATAGGKALHLVRGHFKVRKTGTFWWRPHFAGTLPEKHRDAYIVTT